MADSPEHVGSGSGDDVALVDGCEASHEDSKQASNPLHASVDLDDEYLR